MSILTFFENMLHRLVNVTIARPVQPPKIIDRRETVCIWCRAVVSEGEPHEENCGL